MKLFYISLLPIVGLPAITYLYGAGTGLIDKLYYRYVTWGFRLGMRLKRKAEAGELNVLEKALAYLYILYFFLPSDFGLSAIVSRQMQKFPRPKLTTTLVAETLGAVAYSPMAARYIANRNTAVALRKFMDARAHLKIESAIAAAVALQVFDIIDTKDGDTAHFKNANAYRSKFDQDKV